MALRFKSTQKYTPIQNEAPGSTENAGVELMLAHGASILISTGNCQNQGAREYQEDAFGYSNIVDDKIVTQKGFFAVLADGMGGLSDGKAVANYVVQSAISAFDRIEPFNNIPEQLTNIVNGINRQVCAKYAQSGKSTAGSTLVLMYMCKNRIYWVTVGDSRLYCLRHGHFLRLNEDHDYKNKLYRQYIDGSGNFEDIELDPQKDSLTSFIGKNELEGMDVCRRGFRVRANDTFMLCSDGIYNGISEDGIKEILSSDSAQAASESIVDSIVKAAHPGQDNMTVMVISCKRKK